ncbi:DNA protecting protein DprA [Chitinophagaceae bacterium IBVUCB1]|nr:DNA protecting protein DprA [Chitinophagaceae bacterium IBVUCB1]
MENEWIYRLALTFVKQVGPKTGRALLEQYGTASAVFHAPAKQLKLIDGMGDARAKAFKDVEVLKRAENELTYMADNGIAPIWLYDDNYPERLKACIDSPLLLYAKGNTQFDAQKVVAIVGTRRLTEYGVKLTEDLVHGLADVDGVLIASGLADGIDTIAHRQCVKLNIPTVGVLGHGHDTMYPAGNKTLAKEMCEKGGAVWTEYPSGTIPTKENFPMRNRIVAGMSDVTVVVESDIKGGALITARLASSYNREVAAFPGRVNDKRSTGCNELIRTNVAAMITSADDLIELMNWGKPQATKPVQKKLLLALTVEEQTLIEVLQTKDMLHADELLHQSGLNNSQLAATLLSLEMQGLIKALPGKMYRVN